jgi:endonuclease/exonuclease/phosphatase family metal-dependent hydrolase
VCAAKLEWAAAGLITAWAAARLAGVDRLRSCERWAVPLLSFTPQATAGALAGALLLRSNGPRVAATAAASALTAAVAPRALPRAQPAGDGPTLRVLTANLLVGRAAADSVVELADRTGADVLFLQELTVDAIGRLQAAGIARLLPHQVTDPVAGGPRGNGIYARYPLREEKTAPSGARPAAWLDVPTAQPVRLVCVHPRPPTAAREINAAARWRTELALLPPPGEAPAILAGDFNATLDHAQFRLLLQQGYADAASQTGHGLLPTWAPRPGHRGLLTIDHILVDPRCAVLATSVHQLPGTDHRAVYARIRLPG